MAGAGEGLACGRTETAQAPFRGAVHGETKALWGTEAERWAPDRAGKTSVTANTATGPRNTNVRVRRARVGPWPAPQLVCLMAPGIRAGRRRAVITLQSCPKPASATLQVEKTLNNVWENRACDLREADPPPCSPHSIGRAARHAAASPLFGVDVVAPGGLRQRSMITVWVKITELMPRTNYLQHTL